jgi:thiamine-phosphate diphosphorylase
LKSLCADHNVLFIANDCLDVALASEADGLHVGQDDLPVEAARSLLPQDRVIGCSTATPAEALEAERQGADYIAVGSMYPTPTKPGTRIAGLETLRQVKTQVSVPIVAIGGINADNVAEVVGAGADAVAVISAVLGAEGVTEASRRLAARIEEG